MGKVQCPNCQSFDTSKNIPPLAGCGCLLLFLSLVLGGGVATFYGGSSFSSPFISGILLIVGLILLIIGYVKKPKNKKDVYECKNCKYEFEVK